MIIPMDWCREGEEAQGERAGVAARKALAAIEAAFRFSIVTVRLNGGYVDIVFFAPSLGEDVGGTERLWGVLRDSLTGEDHDYLGIVVGVSTIKDLVRFWLGQKCA